ncbi:hypothetical protein GCM10010493_48790 [Streptomyces lavendulae subsp. grasserius]
MNDVDHLGEVGEGLLRQPEARFLQVSGEGGDAGGQGRLPPPAAAQRVPQALRSGFRGGGADQVVHVGARTVEQLAQQERAEESGRARQQYPRRSGGRQRFGGPGPGGQAGREPDVGAEVEGTVGVRGRAGAGPEGEGCRRGDRRGLGETARGQISAGGGTDPADEPDGQQGVATQREEVVVLAGLRQPEDFGEQGAQQLLPLVRGCAPGGPRGGR